MSESRYVKTKIVAGYVVLLALCLVSVAYVYRVVVQPPARDATYAELRSKRNVAAQTLYHLYQAEGYAQMMTAGYRSYEERYGRELRTVRDYLDSLRGLERDSLQKLRLDTISLLIRDKERRTLNLLRSLRSGGTAGLLSKNIEQLVRPQDTLPSVERAVMEHYDTVRVQRRRRGFFRRIADVFSPPKEDSSIVISATRTVADSLPASAVADTIATVLRDLQDRVTGERIEIYDKAWTEGLNLSYSNRLVNRKIYRLLSEFQREDDAFLVRRIDESERLRSRSRETLGWIAGGAVVLMLLFVAILWRDINRSNRYKRELERANREKQALLEAREKLMLAITHDIKAPLGSIMGYIDLLSRICSDKRQLLYLRNMQDASEHLLALVDSLLDFYRLDMNKVEAGCVAFEPAQLFESIGAGFAPVAEKRGIAFRLDIDPSARRQVAGDPSRIRQIADNLVSNSLKFTDKGSVTLSVHIAEADRLVFSVKDTGRGIGREEQERIFGEFVRLRSAEGVDGFGLGLSIVDRLVKLLGGRIWLESIVGQGSKFIVSVPVGDAPAPSETASHPAFGLRLLWVDDDPLQLELNAALCRAEGIESACCPHPEYAAKLVAEQRFDAVLTDIQMPAMDGFEVLAAIRRTNGTLPVIAVSARTEPFPDGFAAELRKPFSAGELLAVLARVCERSLVAKSEPEAGRASDTVSVFGLGKDGGSPTADDSSSTPTEAPPPPLFGDAGQPARKGFDSLTAFAADDPVAARTILRTFAEQNRAAGERIETALAADDSQTVRALAHRLVPIFTMMGAADLVVALRRLEEHEGPLDDATRRLASDAVEKIRRLVEEAEKRITL